MLTRITTDDGVRIVARAQPRDYHGRWASGGGGPAATEPDQAVDDYDNAGRFSDSYRQKYGDVVDELGVAGTSLSVVVTDKGSLHIADDAKGTHQREVVQEMTPPGATSLGRNVLAVNTGSPGRTDPVTKVKVEPNGKVDPDGYKGADVTWTSGTVSSFDGDQAFELQSNLDMAANSHGQRMAGRSALLRIVTGEGDGTRIIFRRYNPDQPRDKHGRFGSGTGGHTIEDLPRGPVPSIGDAAKGTNPDHGSTASMGTPTYGAAGRAGQRWTPEMGPLPSGAYEENCTNAVMAFEMRMRGYHVQAAPLDVLDRHGYAAGRTSKELDDLVARGWRSADGTPHGRSFAGQKWRSFKDVDREIEQWPEGGRGFMNVGKHVFSVVKKGGKAQYVESQYDASPSRIVTSQYHKKFRSTFDIGGGREEAKVIRLDDLEPTDDIFEAVAVPEG